MRVLMSQKIPLSSSLAECVVHSWTVPPYTSDADQDASRRFFILHYMSFAELRDDGSWNIRAEETGNFAAFETVINAFKAFIARYISKAEIGLRPIYQKP